MTFGSLRNLFVDKPSFYPSIWNLQCKKTICSACCKCEHP